MDHYTPKSPTSAPSSEGPGDTPAPGISAPLVPVAAVLQIIKGPRSGELLRVRRGEPLHLGRARDLDLAVVDDTLSRRHAFFELTQSGHLIVRDLRSTNGTWVNGSRVERADLGVGDRISMGRLFLEVVSPATSEVANGPLALERNEIVLIAAGSQPLMKGHLDQVALTDVLQMLSASRKTGVLCVSSQRRGYILLVYGRPRDAKVVGAATLSAERAVYRMLWWGQGTFELHAPRWDDPPEDCLNASVEALLMEGTRQLDELRKFAGPLDLNDDLMVPHPLEPRLRDLPPELLEVFQASLNYSRVEVVLDHLEDDVGGVRKIALLVHKGYLAPSVPRAVDRLIERVRES